MLTQQRESVQRKMTCDIVTIAINNCYKINQHRKWCTNSREWAEWDGGGLDHNWDSPSQNVLMVDCTGHK